MKLPAGKDFGMRQNVLIIEKAKMLITRISLFIQIFNRDFYSSLQQGRTVIQNW